MELTNIPVSRASQRSGGDPSMHIASCMTGRQNAQHSLASNQLCRFEGSRLSAQKVDPIFSSCRVGRVPCLRVPGPMPEWVQVH